MAAGSGWSGADAEEVLYVCGEKFPPGTVPVPQQHVMDKEGQNPLAEICLHLQREESVKDAIADITFTIKQQNDVNISKHISINKYVLRPKEVPRAFQHTAK